MDVPRILDISPVVSSRTAIFPGDQPFERSISLDFAREDHLLLSQIRTTLHIGAHVDAPNHYHPQGQDMAARDLELYVGPCQVVSVKLARGERIRPEHLEGRAINAPRILFKTGSFPNPDRWNGDFNSLSPELVEFLHHRGVRLIGIDTPSVDPAEDQELKAHQAIYRFDMANLEGIVLENIQDGLYELIALPLRIQGADASPVRAILISPENPRGETQS